MLRRLVMFTLALLSGTGMDAQAASEVLQLQIDGQPRSVQLHVPDILSAEPPRLIVLFHGYGDDSGAFARAVRLHDDWPEAIIAYPRGEATEPGTKRGWQYRAGQSGDRDLKLVDRLLAETASRYGTRPEHTHVAGFSNGGQFVLVLLATRPDAFASFAVVGTVRPDLAGAESARPLMYLYGRGEDRANKDAWAKTVEGMTRLNLTNGPLEDFATCCHLQSPAPGGAPLVFGLYNAGHVWPYRGNAWLKSFFLQDWRISGVED